MSSSLRTCSSRRPAPRRSTAPASKALARPTVGPGSSTRPSPTWRTYTRVRSRSRGGAAASGRRLRPDGWARRRMTERRMSPAGDVRRPTPAQCEFLVACLDRGAVRAPPPSRRSARGCAVDPPATKPRDPARADRHLFALLHHCRGGEVPDGLAPVFHAAVVHAEQLRAEVVGAAGGAGSGGGAAGGAGFEPLLTGASWRSPGVATTRLFLRHRHNIDPARRRHRGRAGCAGRSAARSKEGATGRGRRIAVALALFAVVLRSPRISAAHGVPVDSWQEPAVLALGEADQPRPGMQRNGGRAHRSSRPAPSGRQLDPLLGACRLAPRRGARRADTPDRPGLDRARLAGKSRRAGGARRASRVARPRAPCRARANAGRDRPAPRRAEPAQACLARSPRLNRSGRSSRFNLLTAIWWPLT